MMDIEKELKRLEGEVAATQTIRAGVEKSIHGDLAALNKRVEAQEKGLRDAIFSRLGFDK